MLTTTKTSRLVTRSWPYWFTERVWKRRFIQGMPSPHLQRSWAQTFKMEGVIAIPELTAHAPWLNAQAIALREATRRPTTDGFFLS